MTGAIAIAITDAGTFGKTFSEALENIDEKAGRRHPVHRCERYPAARPLRGDPADHAGPAVSQVLYYLESNTRSATVIGAIVGGGIGLLLTQAIITQKDWEEVAYYMVLIVLMVMADGQPLRLAAAQADQGGVTHPVPKLSATEPSSIPAAMIVNSTFGAWCEVGEGSRVLNSTFEDYAYCDRLSDIANTTVGKFANIAAMTRIGPTDHPMANASLHHFLYRSTSYWDDIPMMPDFMAHRASRRTVIGPIPGLATASS
jgi:hypothetical protein